jgi:hypothetical protein
VVPAGIALLPLTYFESSLFFLLVLGAWTLLKPPEETEPEEGKVGEEEDTCWLR